MIYFLHCFNVLPLFLQGVDESYDEALIEFFTPYHLFVDLLMRVAANHQNVTQTVVNLSAMVAYEGVPLHMPYFAKLWCEIYQSEHMDKRCISALCNCSSFIDYVDSVLMDERQSLNNPHINQFFCNFFPKVIYLICVIHLSYFLNYWYFLFLNLILLFKTLKNLL